MINWEDDDDDNDGDDDDFGCGGLMYDLRSTALHDAVGEWSREPTISESRR